VTRREAEVLEAVGEHLTNAEIASRLYVSERTVETHVSSLLRKLQMSNRRELVGLARGGAGSGAGADQTFPVSLELALESTPLIGRSQELARLRELWRRASAGRSLIAIVTGEAGIGKSRLVTELAADVNRAGGAVRLGPVSRTTTRRSRVCAT
jgi:DNA-binding CsgD family transcriptional regulator